MRTIMIRIIFSVSLILGISLNYLHGEIPAKVVDGEVKLAVATVNGTEAYSTQEKNNLIVSMTFDTAPAPVVVDFIPTAFEIYISTSFKYVNYSAFKIILNTPKKDVDAVKKRLEDDSILKNFKN